MHPEFIRLGPLTIHTYGVLVALGFLLGIYTARRRARREGLDPDHINDLGIWIIVAGILGGKLFYLLFYWPDFVAGLHERGFSSLREGFVFYGGFVAAALATLVYAQRKQLPLLLLADVLAPSVALGHALGRLGCFFEGCCYGRACALPWAVQFPAPHPGHAWRVHPTQLYEVIGNLALFAGLTLLYRRKKVAGQIWWTYLIGYGGVRFGIEFLRGDYPTHYFGLFTSAHFIAVAMILLGVIGLAWRHER